MRFLAFFETTGPKSVFFSTPALTLRVFALATISGIHFRASPTSTVTEVAIHR